MRLEFQLLAAAPGEGGYRILRDTTNDVFDSVRRLAEDASGSEPEWTEFFLNPARRDWPLDKAVAALEGMRDAVSRHGAAWAAEGRWFSSWGRPEEFAEWLDGAIEDARSEPAGTRFKVNVQPD